jgi:hypothetical protein
MTDEPESQGPDATGADGPGLPDDCPPDAGDSPAELWDQSGTVNGDNAPTGDPYRFLIWARDDDPDDTFRIKIWYEDGGEIVVYDNGFDQAIGGGSIKVHNK